MEEEATNCKREKYEVPAVVPSHRSSESWTRASKIHYSGGGMPEAVEGNRTEDGKIVQVRLNVACANKWCKCGQMARRKRCCLCGQMLQLTNVTCSEKFCRSRGRRKGNERAEIRNITMKNHENLERERKRK